MILVLSAYAACTYFLFRQKGGKNYTGEYSSAPSKEWSPGGIMCPTIVGRVVVATTGDSYNKVVSEFNYSCHECDYKHCICQDADLKIDPPFHDGDVSHFCRLNGCKNVECDRGNVDHQFLCLLSDAQRK